MLQQCFRRELAMLVACAITALAGVATAQAVPPRASFAPAPSAQPPPSAPAPVAPAGSAPATPEPAAPAPAAPAPAPPSPESAATEPVEIPSLPPAAIPSSAVVVSAPPGVQGPPSYMVSAVMPACTTRSTPSPCVHPPSAYHHDGFYLRFSAGPHYASFTGDGKSTDVSVHGLTSATMLAIGGTPGEGVVLAGAFLAEQVRGTLHGATKPEGNATGTVGQLGLLLDWFPRPSEGWHAGGLVALGIVSLSDSKLPDSSGAAFAGSLFGGYDFWIGPEWSLGVMATFTGTTRATLKDSNQDKTGYELNALAGGIDISVVLH